MYWEKKLLFVVTGGAGPYPAIEHSIGNQLNKFVKEVEMAKPTENVHKMVCTFQPDYVLVLGGTALPLHQVQAIREGLPPKIPRHSFRSVITGGLRSSNDAKQAFPSFYPQANAPEKVRIGVWYLDDPYVIDLSMRIAPFYDDVFTNDESCLSRYQILDGKMAAYMPLAADPSLFYPRIVDPPYQSDILFIGVAWPNRIDFVDQIASYLLSRNTLIIGGGWDRLRNYSQLKDHIRLIDQFMTPEETSRYYSGAKIVINLHRDEHHPAISQNKQRIYAHSINSRTFEINACRAFQLSDIRPNLTDFYRPGHEIETFHSPEEFIRKSEMYISHDVLREGIAQQGYMRTMRDHTYEARIKELLIYLFGDPVL